MISFATAARSALLPLPEVGRLGALRRSTSLFSQGQVADSLYLIDDGLIKLIRTNGDGKRIIICICGPGHVVGEEVLSTETPSYYAEADVLTTATVFRIPRDTIVRAMTDNPEIASYLMDAIIQQKHKLAEKVEYLCLYDVEYRILHYLAELSLLVRRPSDNDGYQLPITQLELADLVGATRETTSTTLNQLERRGLVKLSRRLLTVPSPEVLRSVANSRAEVAESGAAATVGVL